MVGEVDVVVVLVLEVVVVLEVAEVVLVDAVVVLALAVMVYANQTPPTPWPKMFPAALSSAKW
jgi:hypothetical protein